MPHLFSSLSVFCLSLVDIGGSYQILRIFKFFGGVQANRYFLENIECRKYKILSKNTPV